MSDDEYLERAIEDIEFSPPHVSTDDGQSGTQDDAPPPRPNAFGSGFPNIRPHQSPPPPARSQHGRKVRTSLRSFWAKNIPESLKQFEIPMESVFSPVCMSPTKEQLGTMAARSKCMELLAPEHPSLLSSPNKATPLCFLARAAEGLPVHMQKALFFFTSVANSALDLGHYAAPSATTDVVHDKMEVKAIRRLVSTGVGLEPDDIIRDPLRTESGFISMNDILKKRQNERASETKELVPPVSMHIGFTGAVFLDRDGKERREVFAVLFVIPADNFALMPFILEKFLMKPKMGAQKYEQLMELYLESSSFLREIMRYECFCNLDADENDLGLPEDYWLEPGGMLGTSTVLSPFQIPLKVFNTIKNEHPNADLATIRIIGCPEMTFQRSDEYTDAWLEYMNKSINNDAMRQENLVNEIGKYDSAKDKTDMRMDIGHGGGWPLEVDPDTNEVTAYGLPPLPLMHKFDANGARGNFSVFIASIGDADQALPDLTRAILTAFLVHSSDVTARPEIDHLLKDKRKANPLLVLRTYYGPDADPFSALVLANRQRMWAEALRSDIQVCSYLQTVRLSLADSHRFPDETVQGGTRPGGPAHHQGLPGKRDEESREHDRVSGLPERDGDPDEGRLRPDAVRGRVHPLAALDRQHPAREERQDLQDAQVRQRVPRLARVHEDLGGHEPVLLPQRWESPGGCGGHAVPAHVQVRPHQRHLVRASAFPGTRAHC